MGESNAARAREVTCLGETLVDLLPATRGRLRDCESFSVQPGGAPSNVAIGVARLGLRTAFCGVVGDDELGRLLERRLGAEGIAPLLRFTPEAPTGVWFVALDAAGERTFFSPTGARSADKLVCRADVARAELRATAWLHCGSSSHVLPEGQEALLDALAAARAAGTRVSFDPNVRAHLWREPREINALCARALPLCDVVKLSDEECAPCTGESDPRRAAAALVAAGVKLACITLGAHGAIALRGRDLLEVPAPSAAVVDTTGAGDGFVAGLLSRLARDGASPVESMSLADLDSALRFACAVGTRVCTALGATTALPRAGEVIP